MAKKFFYNRVYNTRKKIINLVIIGVCVIGVIICFILVSNFEGEDHNKNNGFVDLKQDVTIEVNEEFTNEIFFTRIENVKLEDIEVTYPENFDKSKPGTYEVTIKIPNAKDQSEFKRNLIIVDTTKPNLIVKNLAIKPNESYSPRDFVASCTDNSKEECIIEFYSEGLTEDGDKINYSTYTKEGNYSIKIAAKDSSGNQNVQEATLTIQKDETTTEPPIAEPKVCKYGSSEYDENEYLLAVDITNDGCALSLDLYKDEKTMSDINKLVETETIRIKKDAEALNLYGTLSLSRTIIVIVNKEASGIVGYGLTMTANIEDNAGKVETVAEYKMNKDGKRVYSINPHNLAE